MRQKIAAIDEEKFYDNWMENQRMLWQTRTLATFIAATVPVDENKPHDLLDRAKAIGEGVLLGTGTAKDEDDDVYVTEEGYRHKFNDYGKVMSVFGGQGNVSLNRYG